ncbi:MAG: 16S rRNA (guanine(527)-N(7))-methyltransferase RsmG [Clostridia bacterium]|nr:16S rRNA (guanine(527)-N(7))-methyltransferase RsmG [Clostridia bacterium]
MDYQTFQELFQQLSIKNNTQELTNGNERDFYTLTEHLLKINEITNLTAIRNIPDIIAKHYIDSLLAAEFIPFGSRVLDIGCGPGFPTLPLAIARRDLQITALDSTQKKINFVKETATLLSLKNVFAISARAEDHDTLNKLGKFDVVTSRAVARLSILSELAIPYVKIGGSLIALKAAKADGELTEAASGISKLGGATPIMHKKALCCADSDEERCIIVIPKSKETPVAYPRSFGAIKKKPL